jgi:hypothetical protein
MNLFNVLENGVRKEKEKKMRRPKLDPLRYKKVLSFLG